MTEDNVRRNFNHVLKAEIDGTLTTKVGKRSNGESSFHDSAKVLATMPLSDLHEVLEAMGFSNTTFVDALPDEAPAIDLHPTFSEHELFITQGGKTVCMMDDVTLSKFKAERIGEETAQLTFVIKGIPPLKEHFNLERVVLDSHAGQLFMFRFGLGDDNQEDLDLDGEDEQPPVASNVTNISDAKD